MQLRKPVFLFVQMDTTTILPLIFVLLVIPNAQHVQVVQAQIALLALFLFIIKPHPNHAFLLVIQVSILPLLLPA